MEPSEYNKLLKHAEKQEKRKDAKVLTLWNKQVRLVKKLCKIGNLLDEYDIPWSLKLENHAAYKKEVTRNDKK